MRRLLAAEWPSKADALRIMMRNGWLSNFDMAFASAVLEEAEFVAYEPGELLWWEGDESDHVCGLLSGGIGIYVSNARSSPSLATIIRPGIWFGFGPVLDGGDRSLGFRAFDPSIVAILTPSAIARLAASDPKIGLKLGSISRFSFNVACDIVSDLLIGKADKRIAATLLRVTDDPASDREPSRFGYLLTQGNLAEMANVSRAYTNRVLKKIHEAGGIMKSYNHISILDRAKIEEYAAGLDD